MCSLNIAGIIQHEILPFHGIIEFWGWKPASMFSDIIPMSCGIDVVWFLFIHLDLELLFSMLVFFDDTIDCYVFCSWHL
jgi:hypothetical protein